MVAISRFKTKVNIIVLTGKVVKVIQFYLIKQIMIAEVTISLLAVE